MAEFLAVVGGISAMAAIAGTVGNVSLKILDIAQYAGAARSEVLEFGLDVWQFSAELLMVQESLRYNYEKGESPKAWEWVDNHTVIKQTMAKSKRVKRRLKNITRQFRTFQGTMSWICKIKWALQRSLVMALRAEMNSVKASLNLVLNTVRLEEAIHASPTSKEVEILKIQNRALQYALIHVEKQLSECEAELLEERAATHKGIQDLIRLTESIETQGTVLTNSGPSPQRDYSAEGDRISRPVPVAPIDSEITPVIPVNRNGISEIPTTIAEPIRPPTIVNEVVQPNDPNEASGSRPREILQSHGNSDSLKVENRDRTLTEEEYQVWQALRAEVDAITFVTIPSHGNSQNITGYINNNKKSVKAILNEETDINIISQEFAVENGIDLVSLDVIDGTTFLNLGEGIYEKPVGKASFTWTDGYKRSRSCIVHCLVYPNNFEEVEPIVLGRPFIEKRAECRWTK